MDHSTYILLSLFTIFIVAYVGAEVAQRLKLPSVVGQILAGCLIGPSVLGWIEISEPLEVMAEIGVIFLLFSVGLETKLRDLRRVGRIALLVGVAGSIMPFVFGFFWGHWAGFDWSKSLFIGAAFVATSVGITAKVLQELGVLKRVESQVILGAAVIDDIIAMLVLGVVISLQAGQTVNYSSLIVVMLITLACILVFLLLGTKIMSKASHHLEVLQNQHSALILSVAGCLGLAFITSYFGLAAIIGAFLAGVVLAETDQSKVLEEEVQILSVLFIPFFFVVTGAKLEIIELGSWAAIWLLVSAVILAVISKMIGGGLGALSLGKKPSLIVGVGMVPRGEVGIIVASLGLQTGIFGSNLYAIIIGMSLLTSIIAPLLLKKLIPPNLSNFELKDELI